FLVTHPPPNWGVAYREYPMSRPKIRSLYALLGLSACLFACKPQQSAPPAQPRLASDGQDHAEPLECVGECRGVRRLRPCGALEGEVLDASRVAEALEQTGLRTIGAPDQMIHARGFFR